LMQAKAVLQDAESQGSSGTHRGSPLQQQLPNRHARRRAAKAAAGSGGCCPWEARQSGTNPDKIEAQPYFSIKMTPDKTNLTLTIESSGIGMTKYELIHQLGIIARSGTKACLEAMAAGGDTSMIRQFGFCFYCACLVADKVLVISKHMDDEQYVWDCGAGGIFTMQHDTDMVHGEITRGTNSICYLKKDQSEVLKESRLEDLVKAAAAATAAALAQHGEFVSFQLSSTLQVVHEELVLVPSRCVLLRCVGPSAIFLA
jgi:hypothetical protein